MKSATLATIAIDQRRNHPVSVRSKPELNKKFCKGEVLDGMRHLWACAV